jgi:hypothetical protein
VRGTPAMLGSAFFPPAPPRGAGPRAPRPGRSARACRGLEPPVEPVGIATAERPETAPP